MRVWGKGQLMAGEMLVARLKRFGEIIAAAVQRLPEKFGSRRIVRLAEEARRRRLASHQSTLEKLMRQNDIRSGTPLEAMRVLAKALARDTETDRVGFWLLNDAKDAFVHQEVYVAADDRFEAPMAAQDTDYAAVMVRDVGRELVSIDDVSKPGRFGELVTRPGHQAGIVSVMFAPIISYGNLAGYITCRTTGRLIEWSEEHKLFSSTIANLYALVLERQERLRAESELRVEVQQHQRAQDEMEAGRERLTRHQLTLAALMREEAIRSGTPGEATRALAKALARDLGVDRVGFWLLDEARATFKDPEIYVVSKDAFQVPASALDPHYAQIMQRVVGRQTAAVDDVLAPGRYGELFAIRVANRSKIVSAMYAPIISHDAVVGYISCTSVNDRIEWAEEHKLYCSTIANVAALVLERVQRTRVEDDLREANRSVLAANQSKSMFLANMSHEIRTPMNGVLGMTDLLMRTELSERQRRLVDTINHSAKSLLTIINDILDVSRIEANKLVLDHTAFDLPRTIEQTVDLLAETAQKKGLDLTLQVAPDVPVGVVGDAARLRQVVTNIVGNAIKFTAVGEVRVGVACIGGADGIAKVEVRVRDTGIGISADIKERLFQPFEQADATITRRFGGTGLGLAITRHLVERMGGEITVRSELGSGSEFVLRLPLEIAAAGEIENDVEQVSLAGVRAMVLDDRATNREIVASYLSEAGADPVCAETPEEALAVLRKAEGDGRPFALAIVDMVLPGCTGLEVADMIGADPALAGIGLIMATSLSWKGDVQSARQRGFKAFLTKPIHRSELIEAVRAVLRSCDAASTSGKASAEEGFGEAGQAPLGALRVLVAEDNPVNVEVAQEYLGNLNCMTTLASDGAEAVSAFAAPRFDVILMDCQMPNLDGLGATRRIREIEKLLGLPRTPIIAVTANAYAEDRERCLIAGMDDFMSKPFSEQQLRAMLSKWSGEAAAEPGKRTTAGGEASAGARAGSIDQEMRRQLQASHPALFARLIETYLRVAPELKAQLAGAAADINRDVVRTSAHSLKSSSANIGATRLSDMCRDLEQMLRSDAQAPATLWYSLVEEIEAEVEAVMAGLRQAAVPEDAQVRAG